MYLEKYDKCHDILIVPMITELFNYHRDLTQSRAEFYQKDSESQETLNNWIKNGDVILIKQAHQVLGFFYVKYGGQRSAWLEDVFIASPFRGQGYGKKAMVLLDGHMKEKDILAMFVDVIPKNTRALSMYIDCGFDHLNMLQLRKNYDVTLNKDETVEILGYQLKQY